MNKEQSTRRIMLNLRTLSKYTATPGNGCTRLPFTEDAYDAKEFIRFLMCDAGLKAHDDGAGNIFGVKKGKNPDLPCIMMGSHYDSVINGGNFDGIAGVVCALEVARVLNEEGIELEQDFVVAGFNDEEGMRFGTGYFGSKVMLGQVTPEECEKFADKDGITVAQAMKEWGLDHTKLPEYKWDLNKIGKFIEVHIEQGPVLDAQKIELGLVECIVGIQRYMVTVNGRADHAGTTPMDMRLDAVDISTKVVSKLADMARAKNDGTVATSGFFRAVPCAMNVVSGKVEFSMDIRSQNNDNIDDIVNNIKKLLDEECAKCGASYEIEQKLHITPCYLDQDMLARLEEAAKAKGYSYKRMLSGAGHDALAIGQVLPTVMVFVPSKDGRSHCPVEHTENEDFTKAVDIVVDMIKSFQN
ncbi:MAG: M20 family metallo-hydrolase [Ruminococcaceae bacterium]|nr:M20 family metallo-hydrolase [Oscillospiraceae bacterium]